MPQIIIQIGENISNAVYDKYVVFAQFSPFILGAIAIFLLGWILAELAARAITGMASALKLEAISKHLGLHQVLKRMHTKLSPSLLIAKTAKGYIMFLFFIEATRVAKLTKVADFLTEIFNYIPDLIIALFIMIVGVRFANFLQLITSTSLSFAKSSAAKVLGLAIKGSVITFTILTALAQLQIAPILVQILFIGFVSMLALAGGLALGLGGQGVVHEILEGFKRIEIRKAKKE
ncbi:MAG: hypothetical protein V1760_00355 [Candidatus Peregrinibacteria bacterium]